MKKTDLVPHSGSLDLPSAEDSKRWLQLRSSCKLQHSLVPTGGGNPDSEIQGREGAGVRRRVESSSTGAG